MSPPDKYQGIDSIDRFCRQYLQLERELDYPAPTLLREQHVQEDLYRRVFSSDGGAVATPPPPPPRYQLRVLKELVKRIEASIDGDWEQYGVSDDLMAALSSLLAQPLPSELAAAQEKSHVTYTPSLLSSSPSSTTPHQITLLESRNLISAAGTTGLRTWEAALHLGQYLCARPSLVRGKRVLELGAGTGYLSILCAKYLGAAQVVASDGSGDVVANLPENLLLNGLVQQQQDSSAQIVATELKWGHGLVGTEGGVDVVLGADITYDGAIIPALADTLDEVFARFGARVDVLIAATERNRETFEAFVDVCQQQQRGFEVREVVDFPVPPRREQCGPFYDDRVPIRICSIVARQ